jgi:nucleoid-associated protein EbfC
MISWICRRVEEKDKYRGYPLRQAEGQDDDPKSGRKRIWITGGTMDFPDLSKMKEMMGQAKQMQEQMEKKLAATVVEASSGGGVVTVRMNGKKEVLRVKIEPTAMGSTAGDLELLEDLIAAAVNEAGRRADEAMKSSVAGMMGGLGLPDLPGLG